jgi:quercetin dioxygenase-like cupin family protein
MEKLNVWEAPGRFIGDLEHKTLNREGERMFALYYKVQPAKPGQSVMDGAHPHTQESICYIIDGEFELNIAGEGVFLKKGDLVTIPANAVLGTKCISSRPGEMLIVASPNDLAEIAASGGEHSH